MLTLVVLELVLLAPPLVADPPVVLPVTLALPEVAPCKLRLRTPTVLVLVTVVDVLSLKLTVLVEFGPVRLMLAVFVPTPPPASAAAEEAELLIVALVLVELLLLATPEVADPPVVLPDTSAEPELAPCALIFNTVAEFVFVSVLVLTPLNVIVLVELGPVVPIVPV
jgi:hypothetical protein